MRIVIKVGTSSLLNDDGSCVRLSVLANVCEAVQALRAAKHDVVLVTSGAVGMGCMRLKCPRPTELGKLQAMAAVGGMALSRLYEQAFELTGGRCAQVLLTYSTFGSKTQFSTARRAFDELLALGVTPVVNENDVVSCEELKIGDNDNLAAMVASMVDANWLVLLTDVDGLYTADPTTVPAARRLATVAHECLPEVRRRFAAGESFDPRSESSLADGIELAAAAGRLGDEPAPPSDAEASASSGEGPAPDSTLTGGAASSASPGGPVRSGKWGTGGMSTKLGAAQIATSCGARTAIMRAEEASAIPALIAASAPSTTATVFMEAATPAKKGHKRWLTTQTPMGRVLLDLGAAKAVAQHRSTLFPAGITGVEGNFGINAAVDLVDPHGNAVARALVNFSSEDIGLIAGKASADIAAVLGADSGDDCVCSRENIAVMGRAGPP